MVPPGLYEDSLDVIWLKDAFFVHEPAQDTSWSEKTEKKKKKKKKKKKGKSYKEKCGVSLLAIFHKRTDCTSNIVDQKVQISIPQGMCGFSKD